ncbi:hypothetical protein QE152_g31044 [Popillia japonica]|uniref:Uncharacterized protein n=1 Tax=Popillia japonica TaxID=7064 RepID=A0AAW1JCT6_POPJA
MCYYVPAALDILGGAVSGFCINLTYLSYRDKLLKTYNLETLKKICDFKYVFMIIVMCIVGYHITYLVIHRDVYDHETRFIALQLAATVTSIVLLIRILLLIRRNISAANLLLTEDCDSSLDK